MKTENSKERVLHYGAVDSILRPGLDWTVLLPGGLPDEREPLLRTVNVPVVDRRSVSSM